MTALNNMVCLDVTESVVNETVNQGVNMVYPIIRLYLKVEKPS